MAIDSTRVKEIFLEAAELPDEAARAAFLDKACGADAGVRERVEALLRSHDSEGSFLGTPAAVVPDPADVPAAAMTPDSDPAAWVTRTAGSEHDPSDEPLTFLAAPTRPDALGRLGHYEVLQVLGRGGFGIVFRAFDEMLQRVVALKVMAPQLAATSPARKRFLREARSSAQVRHENVVQVYEVAEQPLPYLAMEFIPGETLQQKLDRVGPLDVPETLRIGRQIAEGLAAAHATDLIHRDIKPGNVLLEGGQHKVKITDFGLARAADDASISQSGIIAGTPMYMAPEQALGQTLDQRADLFSLGSVLYQMVAGRPPFRATGTVAVLKRVAEDTPRPIREIIPETPQWLCDIIGKLHAKNPNDRYQSAREVADVLADCEAQLKANAKLKDYSSIPRGKPRRAGRWKWVAVGAAVTLLTVIALAVTEFAGVTQLFRQQATPNRSKPDDGSTPVSAAKQDPLHAPFKNSIGMEFVLVPKGKSWLGGGKDKLGEEVKIPADFYLGKYKVTQEEWEKVMGENPSYFSRTGGGKDAVRDIPDAELKRFPVENVSWDQCQVFAAKLNKLEKETGWVYRLPKSQEWEYACRGGPMADRLDSAFDFYLAKPTNTLLPEQANFDKGLNRTCKVGSYPPNRLGLYDIHGNVWDFCDDAVERPAGRRRLGRGGSWYDTDSVCRVWTFGTAALSWHGESWGLRLARVPVGAPSAEVKTPPLTVAPFTDADVQRIAALPAAQQVEEVRKELMRRNPGFDGKVDHKIEGGVVTEFRIVTDKVTDVAPIRVWSSLRVLECRGTFANMKSFGLLADLTPLKAMSLEGLTHLDLSNTKVTDAGMVYFKDCKDLRYLDLGGTRVGDAGIVHFQYCKLLTHLVLPLTKVTDAGMVYFKDCKDLRHLDLGVTGVGDAGMVYFKDCKDLRHLDLDATKVTDGLAHFKDCKDLTLLRLDVTNVTDRDLVHFKDCKDLKYLGLSQTKVSDVGLAHFKDCKNLSKLHLSSTQVSDAGLAHFKGMPLRLLWIHETGITDLTTVQGMPLEDIRVTPKNITKGLDILRDVKSLKTIGIGSGQTWPVAEFWERYDKGQFKE
jgi:serine/threonine protein kinase